MSQAVEKSKPISKKSTSAGRKVRLWVRAKFAGFRRYQIIDVVDPKLNKMLTKPSSN